jgi:DNA-binding transcriptional MerR regulator
MDTKSQIAFDFAAEAALQQAAPVANEDQPVNVGIRIKALKQVIPSATEITTEPEPVAVPVKSNPIKSTRGRKSIRQTAAEADLINIPEDDVLFQKQYYSMGEVAGMFRVNHSLLRFWENEFDIIQPRKNRKGDRHFRPVDIKNLHLIYHLLRQRKYTIEGAKDFLKKNKKAEERFQAIQKLQQIRNFLLEMKTNL